MQISIRTIATLFSSFLPKRNPQFVLHRIVDEYETLVYDTPLEFPDPTSTKDRELQMALDTYFHTYSNPSDNSLVDARRTLAKTYSYIGYKSPRAAFTNFLYHWQRHRTDHLNTSETCKLMNELIIAIN